MTGNERKPVLAPAALLPTVVAVGLVVLVWAATTGPVGVLGASGRKVRFDTDAPQPTADPSTPGRSFRELTKDVPLRFDLSWLGDLIAYTVLFAVAFGVCWALRWLWRHRWRPPPRPVEVDFDVVPDEAIAEALRRDAAAQIAAVGEGSVRNGIVACWVRLEEVMTSAGVVRHPSDTSAEFAVRVLRSLDLDPRAVGRLAALYREARFSSHEMGEPARGEARSLLEQLHADLRRRRVVA